MKFYDAYRHEYGRDIISLLRINLYDPGENYSLEKSHVIPTLICKDSFCQL